MYREVLNFGLLVFVVMSALGANGSEFVGDGI
jgi:hypothetical protein